MKTDQSRKKYDVRNFFFILVIIANCLSLQLSFFFLVSANIITVGQRCLTINDLKEADKIKRSHLPCQRQVILIWSPISYPFALKAGLRQSFLYSSSDWTVGGANFVVTNYDSVRK